MIKFIKKILPYILSLLSLYSISYISNLSENKFSKPLLFGLFILVTILYIKYLNKDLIKKDKKLFWLFTLFSVLLSITFVLGFNLTVYDDSYINKIVTYIHVFDISNLVYALFNLGYNKNDKIFKKLDSINGNKLDKFLFDKHTFIKSFILILLAWLPVLLAFYPGIFSYDSSVQFKEVATGYLSNANPVSHTLLLGFILNLGFKFFKSYQYGVLLYSIFQMTLLALSMSYIISYVNKRKLPFIYKLICLVIFMFLPTHSVLAITTTKDVIFACIVVLVLIKTYDMVMYKDEFFGKKKIINMIKYILLVFLMFIVRHNGFYGYIFLSLFLIITFRKKLIPILIIVIVPLVMYKGYDKLINKYLLSLEYLPRYTTYNAALCVPAQQLARVYNYAPLTDEEKAEFDFFIIKDSVGFSDYEIRKSDHVTWYLDSRILFDYKGQFFRLYFKYLVKYPKVYVDSYLQQILGYFYIGDVLPDSSTYRTYVEVRSIDDFDNTNGQIKFDSKIPSMFDKYYNMMENGTYQNNFILSILMNNAVHNLLMIFVIALACFKLKFKNAVPYMLLVGLMITNLLGPVALLRYCYYLYVGLPIMILSLYELRRS